MSTLPPPATGAPPPAQPAASRVVSTREAFDILGKWADAHPQDSNHETVVSELEKLGDKSVWDDPSRANEVAGRLNTLLTLINSNVRTAAAVLTLELIKVSRVLRRPATSFARDGSSHTDLSPSFSSSETTVSWFESWGWASAHFPRISNASRVDTTREAAG